MKFRIDPTRGRLACAAALTLACLSAPASAQAASDSDKLFRHAYTSRAVTRDAKPLPLFDGTKIRVNFEHRDGYDVIRWRADCNTFGATVQVTAEHLVTGQITGTEVGCPKILHRQDDWMMRFFASDPAWHIRQCGALKLTAGDRVIKLRRRMPRGR